MLQFEQKPVNITSIETNNTEKLVDKYSKIIINNPNLVVPRDNNELTDEDINIIYSILSEYSLLIKIGSITHRDYLNVLTYNNNELFKYACKNDHLVIVKLVIDQFKNLIELGIMSIKKYVESLTDIITNINSMRGMKSLILIIDEIENEVSNNNISHDYYIDLLTKNNFELVYYSFKFGSFDFTNFIYEKIKNLMLNDPKIINFSAILEITCQIKDAEKFELVIKKYHKYIEEGLISKKEYLDALMNAGKSAFCQFYESNYNNDISIEEKILNQETYLLFMINNGKFANFPYNHLQTAITDFQSIMNIIGEDILSGRQVLNIMTSYENTLINFMCMKGNKQNLECLLNKFKMLINSRELSRYDYLRILTSRNNGPFVWSYINNNIDVGRLLLAEFEELVSYGTISRDEYIKIITSHNPMSIAYHYNIEDVNTVNIVIDDYKRLMDLGVMSDLEYKNLCKFITH